MDLKLLAAAINGFVKLLEKVSIVAILFGLLAGLAAFSFFAFPAGQAATIGFGVLTAFAVPNIMVSGWLAKREEKRNISVDRLIARQGHFVEMEAARRIANRTELSALTGENFVVTLGEDKVKVYRDPYFKGLYCAEGPYCRQCNGSLTEHAKVLWNRSHFIEFTCDLCGTKRESDETIHEIRQRAIKIVRENKT